MTGIKDLLNSVLEYQSRIGLSKEEVFEGVLVTMLSALNIEPAIAMNALDRALTMVRAEIRRKQDLAELRKQFD